MEAGEELVGGRATFLALRSITTCRERSMFGNHFNLLEEGGKKTVPFLHTFWNFLCFMLIGYCFGFFP